METTVHNEITPSCTHILRNLLGDIPEYVTSIHSNVCNNNQHDHDTIPVVTPYDVDHCVDIPERSKTPIPFDSFFDIGEPSDPIPIPIKKISFNSSFNSPVCSPIYSPTYSPFRSPFHSPVRSPFRSHLYLTFHSPLHPILNSQFETSDSQNVLPMIPPAKLIKTS